MAHVCSWKFYEVADNEVKVTLPDFSEFPVEIFRMLTYKDPPILPHEKQRKRNSR